MTYEEIESEFIECLDKGVVKIEYDTVNNTHDYGCNYSCTYHDNIPKCMLRPDTDRWCINDGKYRKLLLSKIYQLHPELFI